MLFRSSLSNNISAMVLPFAISVILITGAFAFITVRSTFGFSSFIKSAPFDVSSAGGTLGVLEQA